MKIAIVGCGAAGAATAGFCARIDEIDSIFLLDNSKQALERTLGNVNRVEHGKLISSEVVSSESLEDCLEGADIILNSASPYLNIPVAAACLRHGAHYIDLASEVVTYPDMDPRTSIHALRELTDRFRAKRITGITNAGFSPGITDFFAKTILNGISARRIDNVSILFADIIVTTEMITSWSPYIMLLETLSVPTVWRDGRIIEIDYAPEHYVFSKPIGKRKVFTLSGHPELVTITEASPTEIHNLSVKAAFETAGKNIEQLTLEATRIAANKETEPRDLIETLARSFITSDYFEKFVDDGRIEDEYSACDVCVEYTDIDNRKKTITMGAHSSIKEIRNVLPYCSVAAFSTGAGAAVLIKLLANGTISKPGIWTCSQLGYEEEVLEKLGEFGIIPKVRTYIWDS